MVKKERREEGDVSSGAVFRGLIFGIVFKLCMKIWSTGVLECWFCFFHYSSTPVLQFLSNPQLHTRAPEQYAGYGKYHKGRE